MSAKNDNGVLSIVVVDDSDFSRSMIINMLKEAEYNVVGEANSAETALQIIASKKPNVVITDIVMPEVSGIELTEKVTKNFEGIAVIVISSLSQEHIVLDAIGAGASDFIPKPIQKQQLIDSLEKISSNFKND
jgi:two-component system chemotaxis response regulator CheY